MTAVSVPTRKATDRSGLWTFLRLLGGWATVAGLAYFLWTPNKDWGWVTLLFGWVLLTILADEFAGWFGYMALVLGVLPFLRQASPEQWLIIFPLVCGALFALLIMKHSGGPFVLPFGAAVFAGTVLGAGKIGAKIDPSLTFINGHSFQRTALLAMAIGVGFSFLRQLSSVIWRWVKARQLQAAARTLAAPAPLTPQPMPTAATATQATSAIAAPVAVPVQTSATAVPPIIVTANPQPAEVVSASAEPLQAAAPAAAPPASGPTASASPAFGPTSPAPMNKNPTIIDLDLTRLGDSPVVDNPVADNLVTDNTVTKKD